MHGHGIIPVLNWTVRYTARNILRKKKGIFYCKENRTRGMTYIW